MLQQHELHAKATLLEVHLAGNMPASRHEEKENKKFTLFTDHNRSLLRRHPRCQPRCQQAHQSIGASLVQVAFHV